MKSLESLLRTFVELHPEDAARAFEKLEAGERSRLFKTLPTRIALVLSQRISPHAVAPLVSELEAERAAELFRDLPPRVASTILHPFDEPTRERLLGALALREIIPGSKKRLMLKELLAGTINGVAVAIVAAAAVLAWRLLAGDSTQAGLGLSLVIGMAMVVNMAAAISGAIIPLILQALGRDPAQSAAIFLNTVTDIVGRASFLGFATAFMPMIT